MIGQLVDMIVASIDKEWFIWENFVNMQWV